MSTLNVIGEFFHNWETQSNFAAARDLTSALADTAPRGHASALLIAADTVPPQIDNPKARVEKIPLRTSMLPVMWHSNQAARPLDGEYIHAFSPLIPLRTRDEDDGSQASVMIPHTLAWDAPDSLPKGQARQIRAYTRRALKHADVIVTPTHAIAGRLQTIYGEAVSPIVLPLFAPSEYIDLADGEARRQNLGLPNRYLATTATPGEIGRLEWLLRAMEESPELPPLVIFEQAGSFDPGSWPVLKDRIFTVNTNSLADTGAVLEGAIALALPQVLGGCYYSAYGSLHHGVPIVHGGNQCIVEIALDSTIGGADEADFKAALHKVTTDSAERDRLSVLAQDRSRSFSWSQTAWQLWEIHANI